ncbi:MAG: prepilin-type N-terminal cleavage/methylation domain-containing protein [Hydrococcus sp. Prado102]|jgi:type II secretion system protein G|nr:prepilin-type N-terminal cleavage/methylation domain-containing protein [Hydrococcus sp. Prado102]
MFSPTNKLTQYWINKKEDKGFTLIELLVVVIILGIMSSIALPNLIKQVEKAREAEAKNNLGAINRAQQAYRFQEGIFATTLQDLGRDLTVGSYNGSNYETQFYSYSVDGIPSANTVRHLATPQPFYTNELKVFASAVFISGNLVQTVICQANNTNITPVIVNPTTCNNGTFVGR